MKIKGSSTHVGYLQGTLELLALNAGCFVGGQGRTLVGLGVWRKGLEEVGLAAVALLGRLDGLEFETMREFWSLFLCLSLALDSAWARLVIVCFLVMSGRTSGLLLDWLQ